MCNKQNLLHKLNMFSQNKTSRNSHMFKADKSKTLLTFFNIPECFLLTAKFCEIKIALKCFSTYALNKISHMGRSF